MVIVSTPDRTNQWLSKLIWKPMKAMKLQTWWRPKVYEKETGLYFFPQFCKNNYRKSKTRILWEKATFWLEEKKVINQAKFWYISISWQVFNWFFEARWKREQRMVAPHFPCVFMTNKMFFQRLNIMRHDVSGSSQTVEQTCRIRKWVVSTSPPFISFGVSGDSPFVHSELGTVW